MKQIKKTLFLLTLIITLVTLVSCFNEKLTIKLDLGYSDKTLETIYISKNKELTRPKDPKREGFVFIGWYKDSDIYNFEEKVSENFTLTAKWEKEVFIVSFKLDSINDQNVFYEDLAVKPTDPVKEGYKFLGWYLDDVLYDFNSLVTKNINLKPKWEAIEVYTYYSVTFDLGYDGLTITNEVLKENKVLEPNIELRSGYIFKGWYIGSELYDFNTPVNKNLTIIAKWEVEVIQTYDFFVAFNSSGGNYKPETIFAQSGEILYAPIVPTKDGHFFVGWFYGNEEIIFPLEITQDYYLTAVWHDITLDNVLINDFKSLNNEEYEIISGIITSFSTYNYLTIEDESDAILVRVEGLNTPNLINLGFKIGNKLTLLAKKVNIGSLLVAQTNTNNIILDDVIYNLNESLDITEETLNNLKGYDAKRVLHNYLIITDVFDELNRLKFSLKNESFTIEAIYDKRYIFTGSSYLSQFKRNDIVKIKDVILINGVNPYLSIGQTNQIEKIGEVEVEIEDQLFKIFYLNDTHGAVFNSGSELGLAKIGNYIKNERDENSIFITGGDMFQGQLISNANKGAVMVEVLNNLNLDAFVIGNHEFDWGLDVILKYFNDETSNVKANFPLLGANVKRKIDDQRPEFIDSHVIINRGDYKIGIIGVIGDKLESSIARFRVDDYYFSNASTAVSETVNLIKGQVDFIIVVNHHSNATFNNEVSKLSKVVAIFNGHTHAPEQDYYNGVPTIQSAANGEVVGKVELLINKGNGLTVENSNMENVKYHQHLNKEDQEIKFIIDAYYEEIRDLYEEEIIKASSTYSQGNLAYFIAELMAKSTNSVFGLQNSGGTRAKINQGPIMASDVFKVFPFDNRIITVEVLGKDLKTLYNRETYTFLDININNIINNKYYKIATNDYVFYNSFNTDVFGSYYNNITVHGDLYETFYEYLLHLKNNGYNYFNAFDPVTYSNYGMHIYNYYNNNNEEFYLS